MPDTIEKSVSKEIGASLAQIGKATEALGTTLKAGVLDRPESKRHSFESTKPVIGSAHYPRPESSQRTALMSANRDSDALKKADILSGDRPAEARELIVAAGSGSGGNDGPPLRPTSQNPEADDNESSVDPGGNQGNGASETQDQNAAPVAPTPQGRQILEPASQRPLAQSSSPNPKQDGAEKPPARSDTKDSETASEETRAQKGTREIMKQLNPSGAMPRELTPEEAVEALGKVPQIAGLLDEGEVLNPEIAVEILVGSAEEGNLQLTEELFYSLGEEIGRAIMDNLSEVNPDLARTAGEAFRNRYRVVPGSNKPSTSISSEPSHTSSPSPEPSLSLRTAPEIVSAPAQSGSAIEVSTETEITEGTINQAIQGVREYIDSIRGGVAYPYQLFDGANILMKGNVIARADILKLREDLREALKGAPAPSRLILASYLFNNQFAQIRDDNANRREIARRLSGILDFSNAFSILEELNPYQRELTHMRDSGSMTATSMFTDGALQSRFNDIRERIQREVTEQPHVRRDQLNAAVRHILNTVEGNDRQGEAIVELLLQNNFGPKVFAEVLSNPVQSEEKRNVLWSTLERRLHSSSANEPENIQALELAYRNDPEIKKRTTGVFKSMGRFISRVKGTTSTEDIEEEIGRPTRLSEDEVEHAIAVACSGVFEVGRRGFENTISHREQAEWREIDAKDVINEFCTEIVAYGYTPRELDRLLNLTEAALSSRAVDMIREDIFHNLQSRLESMPPGSSQDMLRFRRIWEDDPEYQAAVKKNDQDLAEQRQALPTNTAPPQPLSPTHPVVPEVPNQSVIPVTNTQAGPVFGPEIPQGRTATVASDAASEPTASPEETAKLRGELRENIESTLDRIPEGEFGDRRAAELISLGEQLNEIGFTSEIEAALAQKVIETLGSAPSRTPRAAINGAIMPRIETALEAGDFGKVKSLIEMLQKLKLDQQGIVGLETDNLNQLSEAVRRES